MAKPKRYRERGTGSIYKRGKNFYYKIRINGKTKTQLLLDQKDQPVTTRQEAEKAAALLQPILRAQQKEEIALYIADAKNLRKKHHPQYRSCLVLLLSSTSTSRQRASDT